jgi:hypothetical protein
MRSTEATDGRRLGARAGAAAVAVGGVEMSTASMNCGIAAT